MIACTVCKEEKEIEQFSFRNKLKNVRHNVCKNCMKIYTSKHYQENKEEYKKRVKNWVKNNKERRKRNAHNSYAINKGYIKCKCCNLEKLNNFIENCPEDCEVDHIKTVRQKGEHCLKNLRYLTTSTHARKSQWERYNT